MDITKKYLTKKEKFGYGFAALGQGAVYAMVSAWLGRFYTDVILLPPFAISLIMIFARVWDAVNDPIMGMLVDKTRTRFGKMRIYLLIAPLPIAILTGFMFYNPKLGPTPNIIYAAAIYVAWDTMYTLSDVPFWGLPSAMTPNNEERANFLSVSRTMNGIGGAIPLLLVAVLSSASVLGMEKGYLVSAIIFAVFGTGLFSMSFFFTKERIEPPVDKTTTKEYFQLILKNKILLITIIFGVLCFGRYMVQGAISYAADYVFYSDIDILQKNIVLITSILVGVGMFPAMILMPTLFKKFNYKQIGIGSGIYSLIVGVLFFIVALITQFNLLYAIPFLLLMGMPLGIFNILSFAMIADSIDYIEHKTTKRTEGLAFSCQSFVNKFGAAISSALIPLILGIIKYVPPDNGVMVEQDNKVKIGILILITLIPAISMFISVIPLLKYDFIGDKKKLILEELNIMKGLNKTE